jgi:hypothetical protein
MEVDTDLASSHTASYSQVRDALDNELTSCREKLQRDIRRSHRRWNAIDSEAHLRLAKLGYLPKHSMSLFNGFVTPNTSTATTIAKTKVFSPRNTTPESVSPQYHHILASNAFDVQTPVPNYHHCHSIAYNLWTENRELIKLAPEGISEREAEQLQSLDSAASTGKYFVLGFERSHTLAEQAQRIWYFESSITRFVESLGMNLPQMHEIIKGQSQPSKDHHHDPGSNWDTLNISLITRAVKERCGISLSVALSYWLLPEAEEMTHYCRVCKK